MCQGRDSIFLGTVNGTVKEFNIDMQLVDSFMAYESDWEMCHIQFMEGTSLLLTIATKLDLPLTLHLWDLTRRDSTNNAPHCHSTVNVVNTPNKFPLSAFAIWKDYSILAFGFADGNVILVRGDIIHDRGYRQRVVYRSSNPITGLELTEDVDTGAVTLFVASVNRIITVPTTGRNSGKPETVLDKSQGAALGCVTKDQETGNLIVAREADISYYTARQRGPSFAFDIPKKSVFSYSHYLVITTFLHSGSSSISALVGSESTRLIIIDTLNKFIAYSGQMAVVIRFVFTQWDKIHVLGSDGIMYVLKEKDLTARLDILKQLNLYDVAIEVAMRLAAEHLDICAIQKEYGDFLYDEERLTDALGHYIEAIDLGETSQIILKYRDSQYIGCLTQYLEALHNKKVATREHTTLLLNSYAKLKDVERLTSFVEREPDGTIDYDAAIRICRQAGYYSLAAYLSQKTGDADLAVQIKLRDLKDYKGCLAYINSLEVKDVLRILIQYARELLDQFPMETTALLIVLFTGKYVPTPMEPRIPEDGDSQTTEISTITAPVVQSYRAFVNYMSGQPEQENGNAHYDKNASEATYQPPRRRLIFSSFIDHPNEFVIFLEACLECYNEQETNERDRGDLLNTLFEMYLTLANRAAGNSEEQTRWEGKAKELVLASKGLIDQNNMLLVSHLMCFHDGELLARDNEEGFQVDLFRSCAAAGDVQGAISILRKYGDKEKELFPLALSFFISSPSVLEEARQEFEYVLDRIKKDRIMAPLQVIQALSVNSVTTIGHVREYLVDVINSENSAIERNNKLTELYREETKAKKDEIRKLMEDPTVVQYRACASCGTDLDLPAVHFGCKHSYHQRCLNNSVGDAPLQCPKCLPALEDIRAHRQRQDDLADRNDLFESALRETDNKFKVVTDFISRGALTSVPY
jgi:hypothetical protein